MRAPTATPFRLKDIPEALGAGWRAFRAQPGPSLVLGGLFAAIGIALFLVLELLGTSPLTLVLVGGFLLVGPALPAGFFGLYRRHERGDPTGIGDTFRGFAEAGGGFWVVAGLCGFLFLVWVTDAGVLYAFQVGASPITEAGTSHWDWTNFHPGVHSFVLWAIPVGAFLAFGLYLISAFSAPLLYERRTEVIPAVVASIRTVLGNLVPALTWALVIVLGIVPSILIPVLLPITLPILAYGSFALYRRTFPLDPESEAATGKPPAATSDRSLPG